MQLFIEFIVLLGIVLLSSAILPTLEICRVDGRRAWYALLGLIALFVAGYASFLWFLTTKNASQLDLIVAMILAGGSIFVALVVKLSLSSILHAQRLAKKQTHNALHDSLTHLPNRKYFFEYVDGELAEAAREDRAFAIVMIDLDRFKEINDTVGHAIGDVVLLEVARRFAAVVGDRHLLARLGGDEFALLLSDATENTALDLTEQLANALAPVFLVDEYFLTVDMSAGISIYPDHGDERSTLMKRADVAMYHAKETKQRRVVYEASVDQHSVRRLQLIPKLQQALAENRFQLQYQPIVGVQDGVVYGLEALIRWHDPIDGILSPAEFIPILEETNYIREVTRWVIEHVLAESSDWCKRYPWLEMHVNLSAIDLQDLEFPNVVEKLLADAGSEPGSLQFEITESAMLADVERVRRIITSLRDLGVGVSVDDFGTGFSSLSLLRALSSDQIKIDRSFVMDMETNEGDASIVRATIDLAHNIGRKVVAEGVENERILSALAAMDCDRAQGYGICRPMDVDAVDGWLARNGGKPADNLATGSR